MTATSNNHETFLRQTQPVILLGMHRSGTSLTVRLLTDMGIHMGSRLARDAESVHFQWLNVRIFSAAGAKWADVDPLIREMQSAAFVERQTESTARALFRPLVRLPGIKPLIAGFFGRPLWERLVRQGGVTWGWKDPRTTLTFPVWLRIFPNARFVHIVRNGIDVAISIHRRTQKMQRKLRHRLLPVTYSPQTLDFATCFRIWEAHVSFVLAHQQLIPPQQMLEMRYEDLLQEPEKNLRRLVEFLGYEPPAGALAEASRRIDRGRLDNTRQAAAYEDDIAELASSPLMQQLGYNYSPSG